MKALIIGVDGFDEELFQQSNMRFIKSHYYKKIKTVKPIITPACAVSILTGKHPFEHGIVDFYDDNFRVVTSKNIVHLYFTDILSLWGYRLGLWKVPMIYPKKYRGFTIWGLEAPKFTADKKIEAILNKVNYEREEIEHCESDEDYVKLYMMRTVKEFKLFKFLCEKYDVDIGFFWLRYSDVLAHIFYGRRKDILIQYYNFIDSLIRELIEYFEPEIWFVFGDHGFSEKKYVVSIPRILLNAKLTSWKNRYQRLLHFFVSKIKPDTIIKLGLLRTNGFLRFLNVASKLSIMFNFNGIRLIGSEESLLKIKPFKNSIVRIIKEKLRGIVEYFKLGNSLLLTPKRGIALTKVVLDKVLTKDNSQLRTGIHWLDTVVASNHRNVTRMLKVTELKKLFLNIFRRKIRKKL